MCHERERLIGFVYDECDPGERQLVESHLATCPACREELGALRQVRQDLLAWDVPEHGSVWRPFAPPRPALSWRDVPAWAMAVAAGAIFLIGAAGGVSVRAWWPAEPPTGVQAALLQPAPVMTAADLAAIEARVTARVRADLESRTPVSAGAARAALDVKQVSSRLEELEREYWQWKNTQFDLNAQFYDDIRGLKNPRFASADNRVDPSRLLPASLSR
jgi:anti-sigma factor RsiW